MRRNCDAFEEGVVDLAKGKVNVEASRHVADCQACAQKVELLRQVSAVSRASPEPSPASMQRLYGIMPPNRVHRAAPSFPLRELQSVRSVQQDLSVLETPFGRVNVAYRFEDAEWTVTGRFESNKPSTVFAGGAAIQLDEESRFQFVCQERSGTGFEIAVGDEWIQVPALEEDRGLQDTD